MILLQSDKHWYGTHFPDDAITVQVSSVPGRSNLLRLADILVLSYLLLSWDLASATFSRLCKNNISCFDDVNDLSSPI